MAATATSTVISYYRTASSPPIQLWWEDSIGGLIDFDSVVDWELLIAREFGDEAVITKTTGIVGATGSLGPTDAAGEPNVTITPSAGEFADLGVGDWAATLTANPSTAPRPIDFTLRILSVVRPAT